MRRRAEFKRHDAACNQRPQLVLPCATPLPLPLKLALGIRLLPAPGCRLLVPPLPLPPAGDSSLPQVCL